MRWDGSGSRGVEGKKEKKLLDKKWRKSSGQSEIGNRTKGREGRAR